MAVAYFWFYHFILIFSLSLLKQSMIMYKDLYQTDDFIKWPLQKFRPRIPVQFLPMHEALNSCWGRTNQERRGAASGLKYSAGWNIEHFHFLHDVVECESAQRNNLPREPVLSQWSALDLPPDTFNTSRWCTCSGPQGSITLMPFFFFYQSHSSHALGQGPACKTPYEVGKLIILM